MVKISLIWFPNRRFVTLIVLFPVLCSSIGAATTSSDLISENTPYKVLGIDQDVVPGPDLVVLKKINQEEVLVGSQVRVEITITNAGTSSAYEVVVIEPQYPEYSVEIIGETSYGFDVLEPNATRTFAYFLLTKAAGNYTLYETRLEFQDEPSPEVGTTYVAYSNRLKFSVREPLPEEEDLSKQYYNLGSLILSVFIILLLLRTFVVIREPKKHEKMS